MIKRINIKNKGITLISLIVTIIILLILAGISITALTGDNGLIKNAANAKESSEIAEEKEVLEKATILAMGKNKKGDIDNDTLEDELNKYSDIENIQSSDEGVEVTFKSERSYFINTDGDISELVMVEDNYPGNIKKDKDGNDLSGDSLDTAYQINCIEDLCAFSNESATYDFLNKYVKVMVDLNFNSKFSYVNGKIEVEGDIPSCNSIQELKQLLSKGTGTGFVPIGLSKYYRGSFDGNNKKIENIYINQEGKGDAALFAHVNSPYSSGSINKFQNIIISGEIIGEDISAGICARTSGPNGCNTYYENCINKCNVTSISGNAGGIVGFRANGQFEVYINNCCNYGKITGIGSPSGYASAGGIGGIVGSSYGAVCTVTNCFNEGTVDGNSYAGGILGHTFQGTFNILNCYNLGTISTTTNYAGGITGGYYWGYFEIINCYNCKVVTGPSGKIGGIAGESSTGQSTMTIKNSYICNMDNQSNWINQQAEVCTEAQLKSNTIISNLNSYIESNEDDIDTVGLYKWNQQGGNYPTLDSKNVWNGDSWE